ncbi:unnamed protein product [Albugo candida]|uniref:Uncharacterized protein n=1 Tax=Albugo candida TaxID=65357 RepID=A0A024FWV6_9STRA|nr:unnamed protein product [Albugo candida]|eukprot:CCI11668.1 unnamed protein product [Albugo candida]
MEPNGKHSHLATMTTASNDVYVGETQESSDGCSPADWAYGRAYFYSRDYASRDDITSAIIEYNEKVGRAFRATTDATRGFEPPHTLVPHTCDATMVDLASYEASRGNKSSYVALIDSALQFVVDKGRDASPAEMHKKLMADGRRLTYQTCVDACIRLKSQLFDEDRTQYQFILSYVHEMNKRGHKADITLREDKTFRVVIVYNPGIHVLSEFANRGINLDGTFMKHKYGGVLLVTCCKTATMRSKLSRSHGSYNFFYAL